jgi:hypothetical protein
MLHVRAKTGTRIEETARLCDLVENSGDFEKLAP